MPPSAQVIHETDAERGWWFDVEAQAGDGSPLRTLRMRLDWADYEHWTRGKTPPSVAAAAIVRAALELNRGEPLPETFDAAGLRRRLPGLDERVRASLSTDLRGLGPE